MRIKVKVLSDLLKNLPTYESPGSAGLDLCACINKKVELNPNAVELVPTGIAIFLEDENFAGLILPRSGLGHKKGLVLGNLIGLIDSDYQGELMISCWNRGTEKIVIEPLTRIAQLVIVPVKRVSFEVVQEFKKTNEENQVLAAQAFPKSSERIILSNF